MITQEDAKKILSEEKPTGWDLGRLLTADKLNLIFFRTGDIPEYTPLYDKPVFSDKVQSLDNQKDIADYMGFLALQNWYSNMFYQVMGHQQQIYRQAEFLTNIIHQAVKDEDIYQYINQLPVIMTQQEFDEFNKGNGQKLTDRQKLNGIAVLFPIAKVYKKPDKSDKRPFSLRIDEKTGKYQAPKIHMKSMTLSRFYPPEGKKQKENIRAVEAARNAIRMSYYYVVGYNKIMSLLQEVFDLEEFKRSEADINLAKDKIKTYNQAANDLKIIVENTDYETDAIKKKKLAAIAQNFPQLNTKDLKPKAADVRKAKRYIQDFRAFENDEYDIRPLICYL